MPQKRVLVLGGGGFVGRHTVAALLKRGTAVVVASRAPERLAQSLGPAAALVGRRRIRLERMLATENWLAVVGKFDCVVNCVGILRPSGSASYERVHCLSPAALANACRIAGVRLVHVSALGLENPVRSRFLTSKRDGERAIATSDCDWYLVRPSLLDGEGGFGATWIRRVANWPLQLLPANSSGLISPLDVGDLGEGLAELALASGPRWANCIGRVIELGGNEARDLAEHLMAMRSRGCGQAAQVWSVPAALARALCHLCDLTRLTPFSYGHYELLMRDNVPRLNALETLLGRAPRRVVATDRVHQVGERATSSG